MLAYGTMQQSEAFRMLCKAKGLHVSEYNDVAMDLDTYRGHARWKDLIKESKKFIGVVDSVSPHPCAVAILSEPISENLGVVKVGDVQCAVITSGEAEDYKYLKED